MQVREFCERARSDKERGYLAYHIQSRLQILASSGTPRLDIGANSLSTFATRISLFALPLKIHEFAAPPAFGCDGFKQEARPFQLPIAGCAAQHAGERGKKVAPNSSFEHCSPTNFNPERVQSPRYELVLCCGVPAISLKASRLFEIACYSPNRNGS